MRSGFAEVPPADLDLERTVLGGALHTVDLARTVAAADPTIFSLEKHRAVHKALQEIAPSLNGAPPDLALVRATAGDLVDVVLLSQLVEIGFLVVDVEPYLAKLYEFAAQREEITEAKLILSGGRRAEIDHHRERAVRLRAGPATINRPRAVTAAELLARKYPAEDAIVGDGIVPRQGLVVVGSPPKFGKSTLVKNCVFSRTIPRPWLGHQTTVGRTVIAQAEIPERELQGRVRLMKQHLEDELALDQISFVTDRGLRLDTHDGLAAVRAYVEDLKPDLLVLDPLARLFSGDENSARDVGRLVGSLDDLIQHAGVAIILVHHTAKPTADNPREGGQRLRGSSALFAAADSVLMLEKVGGGLFRLTAELRHAAEPEPVILRRTDTLWFEPAGPPEELVDVAALVRDAGLRWGQLVQAIQADQEIPKRSAERLLAGARKAGLITPDSAGEYRATAMYRHAQIGGERNVSE